MMIIIAIMKMRIFPCLCVCGCVNVYVRVGVCMCLCVCVSHANTSTHQLAIKISRAVCNDCTCQARWSCIELHFLRSGQREFPVTSDKRRRTGRLRLSELSLHKQILIQPAGLSAGCSAHSFCIPSLLFLFPHTTLKKHEMTSLSHLLIKM